MLRRVFKLGINALLFVLVAFALCYMLWHKEVEEIAYIYVNF